MPGCAFLQEVFSKGFKHENLMKSDFKEYYNDMLEKYLVQYCYFLGRVFMLLYMQFDLEV